MEEYPTVSTMPTGEKLCSILIDSIRGIVWEADPRTFRFSFVSSHAERILGYPVQQWIDEPDFWRIHTHPNDVDWCTAYCLDASEKGEDHDFQYRMIAADGRTVWLRDIVTVVRGDDGNIRLRGIMLDITADMKIVEELRESEERYRSLIELAPEAVYLHKPDGKIVFANSQGAKLVGAAKSEELYGREIFDLVHPDYHDFVHQRMENTLRTGESNPLAEELFVRLDGSTVPVETVCISFSYFGEKALLVIVRDVSERRKLQDEFLKAQKLESLGVLAGGIAHDFNNILTGILGNLSIARLQLGDFPKIAKRLEECEKATRQAGELTRQLLTFSRGGEPVKRFVSTVPLIKDAASFAIRGSNVKCRVKTADDLWSVEADEGQLSQVLHNLLINAVQSMPAGGKIIVRAENRRLPVDNPQLLPEGAYICIAIQDQGCGIPNGNLSRIFDPYFTTKPDGSGLGLASVYSIVKRHGGSVEVSSPPGAGACFTVHLPASPGRSPDDSEKSENSSLEGRGRILVMDDEEMIRDVASEILEFIGYRVECCKEGSEAVKCFSSAMEGNDPFSAVILDLTIPGGMGGREAATLILAMDPHAVLIAASGYSSDPIIANCDTYGFFGSIAKPFGAEALAREVERVILQKKDD